MKAMKTKGVLLLLLLGLVLPRIQAQVLPQWVKVVAAYQPEEIQTTAPLTELDLASLMMPKPKENLIGTRFELKCSAELMFNFSGFGHYWSSLLLDSYYKDQGMLLDMGQPQQQEELPLRLLYSIGLTEGNDFKEKPLLFTVSWKNPKTGEKQVGTITGSIRYFYGKHNFLPEVTVFSPQGTPLKKGKVQFTRLGPGENRAFMADFDITDGQSSLAGSLPLSPGHYEVRLKNPEKCARILNRNLIVLPEDSRDADKFHFKAGCEKKYTIYAYYNAPGFLKAGMVWRHSTVRFPEEGEKPQVFDVMAYQKAGGQGEPKGTDGKKLQIPYSMTLPMIGKQTFYGVGGDGEYETPEVLYIKSLGPIPDFRLSKRHDALNSCHIVSTNGGAPHLELSIDIYGGSDGEYPEQVNIWCNNTLAKFNSPAFPTHFKVIRFTPEDIEKFKSFEKIEKTISNGKATLRVVFEPEKPGNN
jgi:hypothetical protein